MGFYFITTAFTFVLECTVRKVKWNGTIAESTSMNVGGTKFLRNVGSYKSHMA
jgi:hypothetical protein